MKNLILVKLKYEEDCVLYRTSLNRAVEEKTLKDKEARRKIFEELRKEFE